MRYHQQIIIYICGIILVLLMWHAIAAEPVSERDCELFATMVQRIDAIPPERRALLQADAVAQGSNAMAVVVVEAINFVNAGGTPKQAWLQCNSY